MYTGHASQGQVTNEWIDKTDAFLGRAFGVAAKGASKICCPCSKCANRKRQTKKVMGEHLSKNGFMADYTRWVYLHQISLIGHLVKILVVVNGTSICNCGCR